MSTVKTSEIIGLGSEVLPENLKPITASAWVSFDGTGTVAIRDEFNVSSVTDNNIGRYVVNFTADLATVNYVTQCNGREDDSGGGTSANDIRLSPARNAPLVGSVQVNSMTDAGSFVDVEYYEVLIFGGV